MAEQVHRDVLSPAVPDRMDLPFVRLALILVLGATLALLDTTVVNVAIDSLATEFSVSLTTIQWVSTAYLIAVAIAIPIAGWAIDRFGGREVWLAAVGIFVAGSLLAGLAWDAPSLIGFRAVQGLGGGMIEPVVLAMVAKAAGPKRLDRAMALMLVPINLGPIIGPIVGGLIVDEVSWRWIFLINIPLGLAVLALGRRYIPRDEVRSAPNQRFDLRGVALLSPGFAALIYALTASSGGEGFGSQAVLLSGALGVALLVLYGVHALRMKGVPLLDVRLFANPRFALASLVSALVAATGFTTFFLTPLYFQQVHGESALTAGLLLMPMGTGIALGMATVSAWSARLGTRRLVLPGAMLMIVASIGLAGVDADLGHGGIAMFTGLRGIGIGLVMGPTMASVFRIVRPELAARATSALYIVFQLAASMGVALVAVVLQGRLDGAGAGPLRAREMVGAFSAISWGHAVLAVIILTALHAQTQLGRSAPLVVKRSGTRPELALEDSD